MTTSPSLERNKNMDRWISFDPDNTVTIRPGKVELGQAIGTALALIAAEELGVDVAQIVVAPPDTAISPDEGYTAGSLSMQHSGSAIRRVAAEARAILLARAVEQV
ncbi:MAG: molybdopterin-dependent oxidoreductase [Acidobacteria bacterium]|nr:molybdopterin-dependent oxidoreductase [Acidobacteriota bacterium]